MNENTQETAPVDEIHEFQAARRAPEAPTASLKRTPNEQPGRAQRRAMAARYRRTSEGKALLARLRATHRQAQQQATGGVRLLPVPVGRSNAALRHEDTYAVIAATQEE